MPRPLFGPNLFASRRKFELSRMEAHQRKKMSLSDDKRR